MEWKFIAVKPDVQEKISKLTSKDGKYAGYRKNEVVSLTLQKLEFDSHT